VKLSPGVKFSVRPSILLNSWVCSPLGMNKGWTFPLGDEFHPWGPTSPLGANHVVKNGPLLLLQPDMRHTYQRPIGTNSIFPLCQRVGIKILVHPKLSATVGPFASILLLADLSFRCTKVYATPLPLAKAIRCRATFSVSQEYVASVQIRLQPQFSFHVGKLP
jgi:hypothetical protein